jgi:hypothetical protein
MNPFAAPDKVFLAGTGAGPPNKPSGKSSMALSIFLDYRKSTMFSGKN